MSDSNFPPETPKGNVLVGKNVYTIAPGEHRWESRNQVVTTDAASPNQIAENMEPFTVKRGEKLSLTFEGKKPKTTVYIWSDTGRLN